MEGFDHSEAITDVLWYNVKYIVHAVRIVLYFSVHRTMLVLNLFHDRFGCCRCAQEVRAVLYESSFDYSTHHGKCRDGSTRVQISVEVRKTRLS